MNFTINHVPDFYHNYIRKTEGRALIPLLIDSGHLLEATCGDLDDEKSLFRYASGKWSIKDLIQHLIDSERVFVYRAMRFARNDKTALSGFDQDDYVPEANADTRPLEQLLSEFKSLRASTIVFFDSLHRDHLSRIGVSNGVEMSVEMIGYIIAGHTLHHLHIITERYIQ